MIPLKDRNPTRLFPAVNVTIIAVNVLVFLYEVFSGEGLGQLFDRFALVPASFGTSVGISIAASLTIFSSLFLHGGWLHLLGNMLYLWIFGDNVEDKLGHGRYLLFYLLCGAAAGALHVVMAPASVVPTVGASGAISGVLAAYLVMFPRARVVTLIPIFIFLQVAELPALVVLGFWFVLQFVNGLTSLGVDTADVGGVAWWAHIGGFVAGLALVVPFRRYR